MAEMTTTKGSPSIFKGMQAVVAPLAESLKVIQHNTAGLSVEKQVESDRAEKQAVKIEKKQNNILSGMWESMKKQAKENWFVQNWKKILATLVVLFAPLEWLKKIWGWMQQIWDFIAGKKATQEDVDKAKKLVENAEQKWYETDEMFQKRVDGLKNNVKTMEDALANGGERVGGLFGKGGPLDGFEIHTIAAVAALALFGPAMLTGIAGMVTAFGIAKMFFSKKPPIPIPPKIPKTAVTDPTKAHKQALKENAKRSKAAAKATVAPKAVAPKAIVQTKPTVGPKISPGGSFLGSTSKAKTPSAIKYESSMSPRGQANVKPRPTPTPTIAPKAAGKIGAKALGKSFLKKIPGLGLLFGLGFGAQRALSGDWTGAGMEVASGAMSIVPGIGTAGSIGMDATLMARDMGAFEGDKHKAVKINNAKMDKVSWNKLGGRDTVEGIILSTWNQAGVSAAPTFTSGFRSKDHEASLKNPRSQHIQKTAFDLRSKDLGSKAPGIFTSLMDAFSSLGLTGQHETGNVNEQNRTGEHFHFQLAAKGFEGIVGKDGPRGFIAGEAGEELVRIQPLVSPDDKMNAMNTLNTKNQTLQQGQSGSSTTIQSINKGGDVTQKGGDVLTSIPKPVHAPKLTSSLNV
jgi:hypothetical protein